MRDASDFLIPPRRLERWPGWFTWPARSQLCSARMVDRLPLEQLAGDLRRQAGIRPQIVWHAWGTAALRVQRSPTVAGAEAYRLEVGRSGVQLTAAGDAGVYYGVQTLRELVAQYRTRLPCCRIADAPDFARRGVYLDCARGKVPTVATLCALIERLARWKINELQLYLKNNFTWRAHPTIGRGFGRFTPADLLTIQEHARRHHVRFVPSLASFSHMELILALPAYRHLAEMPGAMGWRGGTMLCPTDFRSLRLVGELYREFVPLFEAADFNVCCDETWELGRGRSSRRARQVGAGRVYLEFLLGLHRLCANYGKRLNAWGDIVLQHPELIRELPRDVVMLNWDYAADGTRIPRTAEFQRAGVPVMVCPGTSGWTTHATRLRNAMLNIARFADTGRRYGAVGLLNTDWGDYGHRNTLGVSLHALAYGAAHAWNGRGVDAAGFTRRFTRSVFRDHDSRWAEIIELLGGDTELVEKGGGAPAMLYHALVEPLQPPATRFVKRLHWMSPCWHYPAHFPEMIGKTDPAALHAVAERLMGIRWPAEPHDLAEFERLALQEVWLAGQMDLLGACRALLGHAVRGGQRLSRRGLLEWAEGMREMAEEFGRLWLARNKPLRLPDNLRLMALAAEECVVQAGRCA